MLAVLLALGTPDAAALCLDGRRPTLRQEFAQSDVVAFGRVTAEQQVADPDDPDGVKSTRYTLVPARVFKGSGAALPIISENMSSRFPMTPGADYLVFVRSSAEGFFIDACGNSARVKTKDRRISAVAALAYRTQTRGR